MKLIRQRGYVLMLVLVVVLVVAGLSAVAIRQSLTDVRFAFATGKVNELFVMADMPLTLLTQQSAINTITANDGVLNALIRHHQDIGTHHDMSAGGENQTVAFACYDQALGVANFARSRFVIEGRASCDEGQVWLWLVLLQAGEQEDFSSFATGVPLDEATGDVQESGVMRLVNYRVRAYALAVDGRHTPCANYPMQAKTCLDDNAVIHQMLVREFDYAY